MLQELLEKVLLVLYGAWRYRWYSVVLAWVISLGAWVWVTLLPDQYQSSARVYVDTQTLLKPLLSGLAVQTNDAQRISLMTRTLMSRPTLEKLARMTDLDLEAKTAAQMDELIRGLSERLRLQGAGRTNLYTIRYRDKSPERAKLVAQSLLTLFVEGNLGDRRKETDSASRFLEDQIRDHEQRLQAAEERVKEFKQTNIADMSGNAGGYYQALQKEQAALEQSELSLRIATDQREELKRQLDGEVPTFGLMPEQDPRGLASTPYDRKLAELESKLNELLVNFTSKHPDAVALQRSIDRLKEQQKAFDPESGPDATGALIQEDMLAKNPVYQQLKLRLADADSEVAAKRVLVEDHRKHVEAMQRSVDRNLEVEAEFKRLNRDYGLIKKNYDSLMARYESLKLAEKVDTTGDVVSFRVIEPPRVPLTPSGPDRLLLSSLGFGIALLAGIGLALGLSQLIPVFYDRRSLSEASGMLVLGSVNMVWTDVQTRRQKLTNAGFVVTASLLFAAYGALTANYLLDIGII